MLILQITTLYDGKRLTVTGVLRAIYTDVVGGNKQNQFQRFDRVHTY